MQRLPDYEEDRERRPMAPYTSGMAVTSLVSGIIGLLLCPFVGPLMALICGFIALAGISGGGGRVQGRGLAIAGIILGFLGIPVSLFVGYVLFQGFQHIGTMGDEIIVESQLHRLGMAMHNYHEDFQGFPPYAIASKEGKPLLSWRVALLPYLEHDDLYKQFHIDEPWDSPHNIKLLDKMPSVYHNPRFLDTPANQTYFRVFVGPDTVFRPLLPNAPRMTGVTRTELQGSDGASNTLMIVEAGESVPWTKPDELTFTKDGPLPALGGPSGDIFVFMLCDGTVHRGKKTANPAVLRALINMKDGKAVSPDELK